MSVLRPADSDTRRQWIGALALVAVGLVFIWRSLADLPFGTVDNPGPGITPLALAILLVVFPLWSMAGSTASAVDSTDTGDVEEDTTDKGATLHAVFIILGILVSALAFDVIGYRLTVLGLLLFYLGVVERKPLIATLLVSFGIAFGSHALFVHVLKVSLPSGPWGL
jgi:hypothetical protein